MPVKPPEHVNTPVWFRCVRPEDAALTLRWRQDEDITRFMYTDVSHGVEEQRAWIERCATREDFRHYIIMARDRAVGYLSFADIDRRHLRCSTGNYIFAPEDRRAYSGLLHTFIMDYCFHRLGCHKVVNSFMAGNERNVKIQQVLRFRQVGTYRDHVFKHGQFHDVHVFELLASEWAGHRRLFSLEQTRAAFEDWPMA